MKNFLMIVLKNALNAIITNAALMTTMSGAFNIHSSNGWWNLLKSTGSVVMAREVMVWGPVLLKWTSTNAEPPTPSANVPIPGATKYVTPKS